jgi:hypothetical protein
MTERLSFKNGIQYAWDSTSLTLFKECPRKYYYSIAQGYATREQSVHLTFGIYLHKYYERYHYHRAADFSHEDALHMVVTQAMKETGDFKSDDKYKNRETLIRTIVWYLEEFKDDPARTVILHNGKPAVELSFRFEIPEAPDFLYCGHMDRIAEFGGQRFVFDYKSTKRALYNEYFAQFTPHNQMTGYTLGGKITFHEPVEGVIIDAAQVGVNFSRFSRGTAPRDEGTLEEWLTQTAYWVKLAASYAEADFWPLNESSCDKYFGCPFRPVCSKSPRQREVWLKADYVHRLWDPLQIRGDI